MSKMKQLDEIAQGVADVTLELMNDSVDWQIADSEQMVMSIMLYTHRLFKWQ